MILWLLKSPSGQGNKTVRPEKNRSFLFTTQEIPTLDLKDEIEYVSARLEEVALVAAMQKPIKEEETGKITATGNHREQVRWKINWACLLK